MLLCRSEYSFRWSLFIFAVVLIGGLHAQVWAADSHNASQCFDNQSKRSQESCGETNFDAVPFGYEINGADSNSYGVRWTDARKIRKVVVEFNDAASMPRPEDVRIEYWNKAWNGGLPGSPEVAAGTGWLPIDDWVNGTFKIASTQMRVEGSTIVFTFNSSEKEFPKVKKGALYRKTLWIRVCSEEPFAKPKRIKAFTESYCLMQTVRIQTGSPALKNIAVNGDEKCHLEVFNGQVKAVRAAKDSKIKVDPNMGWTIPAGQSGDVEADILMTSEPLSSLKYDKTIVTIRSNFRPLSFCAEDAAAGERILVDDLGVMITRASDPITLAEYRNTLKTDFHGKAVYDRIFEKDEQTLSGAWTDMPVRRPLEFWHALPGNRNSAEQLPSGDITIPAQRLPDVEPSNKDTPRKLWNGSGWLIGWLGKYLTINFGLPDKHIERELLDGYLPVLRTWCQDDNIRYELTSVMDSMSRNINDIRVDDPTVVLVRGRFVNTSDTRSGIARLNIESIDRSSGEKLVLKDGNVFAKDANGLLLLRFLVETGGCGALEAAPRSIHWTKELGPGQSCNILFSIPTITLTKDDEIRSLRGRNFDADQKRIADFWRDIADKGMQITTPETRLNDFYKAHIEHHYANCIKELHSDRLHAHVSTHAYGVFPNESCMMIMDLDRCGHPDIAERCLDSFLYYQGTKQLLGVFSSQKGLFYGSGGYEQGQYGNSHGWVMWAMAKHWQYTRDRKWMQAAAPKLIEACQWVINERSATMKLNPDGTKALGYGWLPVGSLEDVKDYWYWMATNAATVRGMETLADALADFGDPQGPRLQKEAKAYREDFLRSMEEARIMTPVVKLRDSMYVPKYPSRLYERGRAYGWVRETLEGSVHMLTTRMLAADTPNAVWILKDHEDNIYTSEVYGYAIPNFELFWFQRGGFSNQANLLESPLPYLYRDEIKHYVRAFFNSFASAFDPDIRILNEHSLPELGYTAGSVFKTSDEAQVITHLRLMFINERGNDLYLGQAIPRYWLANGKGASITNAATQFGPLSLSFESHADSNEIKVILDPPQRNRPENIYVRARHPASRPIKSVTLNGRPYERFDVEKEWVILPHDAAGRQEIILRY